jgi:2-haloacid dehalogenase
MERPRANAVIFDVGGVLLDCDPRYLYRHLFDDRAELNYFLNHVCDDEWNRRQDSGRDLAVAVRERSAKFPRYRSKIEMYYTHFDRMISGPIAGMPELLNDLIGHSIPLYGLTNWPEATFRHARDKLDQLKMFRDIVISSTIGLLKPDPAIFRLALDRFGLTAERTIFVDDHPPNVEAARTVGLMARTFVGAEDLRDFLAGHIGPL